MPVMRAPNVPAIEAAYSAAKSCGPRPERLTTTSLSMARPPRGRRERAKIAGRRRVEAVYARRAVLQRAMGLKPSTPAWSRRVPCRVQGADAIPGARDPRSLLLALRPETLKVGPEVGDVLVVLDADECHAGAGHLLHRRADILDECVVVPGDAGILVGRGIVESLVGAGLASLDTIERRAELHFCICSDIVTGRAQSLEHLLAGGGILRQARSRRCRKYRHSNHQGPHPILLLFIHSHRYRARPRTRPVPASAEIRPCMRRAAGSRLARQSRAVRMASSACTVNGSKRDSSRRLRACRLFRKIARFH